MSGAGTLRTRWRAVRGSWSGFSPATRRFLAGSALMGAAWSIPWSLLPLYLERCGHSKADIGFVVSGDAWGKVLVALPAAFVLARRATRPVLLVTSLASGLAYALLPWMPGVHALFACNVLAGLSWSVHFVAIAPFLYRHAEPEQRAVVFGVSEAVHTGAAVLGAWGAGRLVTALASAAGGERGALAWTLACAGVLACASLAFYARIAERPVHPGERAERPLAVFWRERSSLARFAVPQLLVASGAGLVISFLGLYFQDRFGVSPGGVANLHALSWLLMTGGYLVTPFVMRRFGFVGSIVVLEVASMPFFLVLAFTVSFPVAVSAFLLRGLLMNAATPVLKNFSMHASSRDARALQNGVTSTMSGIGWAIGPRLGGWLLDKSAGNYKTLMCTTVAFYAVAALATWILLRPLESRSARADSATAGIAPDETPTA